MTPKMIFSQDFATRLVDTTRSQASVHVKVFLLATDTWIAANHVNYIPDDHMANFWKEKCLMSPKNYPGRAG